MLVFCCVNCTGVAVSDEISRTRSVFFHTQYYTGDEVSWLLAKRRFGFCPQSREAGSRCSAILSGAHRTDPVSKGKVVGESDAFQTDVVRDAGEAVVYAFQLMKVRQDFIDPIIR